MEEELNIIKEEVETMNKKLQELTEDELKEVTGGRTLPDNVVIHFGQLEQMVSLNEFPITLDKEHTAKLNKMGDARTAIITDNPSEAR